MVLHYLRRSQEIKQRGNQLIPDHHDGDRITPCDPELLVLRVSLQASGHLPDGGAGASE